MDKEKGVILFNRGDKMIVRAIVTLKTLREHYSGPVTMFLEQPYPKEFDDVCRHYNVDIIYNKEKPEVKALQRKNEMFLNPPYEKNLWIDTDVIINGPIDEMFDYLEDNDLSIPHFAGWISNGRTIKKRIDNFIGLTEDKYIEKALQGYPAINTGILSFRNSENWRKFVNDWVDLTNKGFNKKVFISDEVSLQVLYPSIDEWGLKCFIAPQKFNVSVKFGENVEDKRIIHMHGQKHCLEFPLCSFWKNKFREMTYSNEANINSFLKYADKRLNKYLQEDNDVTIVTACDEKYVDILRETFPNWRKYKKIDKYPVMIFVHGIPIDDNRLDFLKLPNVQLIPWKMENADSHREEMLSAFVFGTAEHVKTDYWLKLDADSYATNYIPFIDEDMKKYAFCGHKWSYSMVEHIELLDKWAKNHHKPKLKNAPPMMMEGRVDGKRFFHNKKRTISFIQLHKTKFTKFCVSLLNERKLPAPTQDTFMFFVCDRFDPHLVGHVNFKKNYGFAQGNGRQGIDVIRAKLKDVDALNVNVEIDSEETEEIEIKSMKTNLTDMPYYAYIDSVCLIENGGINE